MRLFDIEIDGKPFIDKTSGRQFRVTFTSRMQYSEMLSFLDLAIYNLSRDTAIEQGKSIRMMAGYEGELDEIFKGRIITVLKERDGPNIVTRLLCRSGAADVRKSVSTSVGKNATALDAIRQCAAVLGPDGGPVALRYDAKQWADAPRFVRGYALNGDALEALNALAGQFGFEYLVTDDALQIDRKGYPVEGEPQEVSLFTGMIGVPEAEGDVEGIFVNVTHRLAPRLRLATNVELKSEYASYSTGNFYITPPANGGKLSGTYKIVEVSHQGDSWGGRWQTVLRLQKV